MARRSKKRNKSGDKQYSSIYQHQHVNILYFIKIEYLYNILVLYKLCAFKQQVISKK